MLKIAYSPQRWKLIPAKSHRYFQEGWHHLEKWSRIGVSKYFAFEGTRYVSTGEKKKFRHRTWMFPRLKGEAVETMLQTNLETLHGSPERETIVFHTRCIHTTIFECAAVRRKTVLDSRAFTYPLKNHPGFPASFARSPPPPPPLLLVLKVSTLFPPE